MSLWLSFEHALQRWYSVTLRRIHQASQWLLLLSAVMLWKPLQLYACLLVTGKNGGFVCMHIKVSLFNSLYLFLIVLDAHMSWTNIYFMSFSTLMSHLTHVCHIRHICCISITCLSHACMSLFPVRSLAGPVCTMLPRSATRSYAASCYRSSQILGSLTR